MFWSLHRSFFFFFNDTATTEIYTLSLHDALPIFAAEFVAKSEPDGYTLLVGSIGVFSINAALYKDLRYHPVRDFAPITLAVITPNVLVTKLEFPAHSVKELVDYAKKNPGKISYAVFC